MGEDYKNFSDTPNLKEYKREGGEAQSDLQDYFTIKSLNTMVHGGSVHIFLA